MKVLFIDIDTLRADHLGCYGYARNTSPHVDGLARDGVLFEKLLCVGVPTHPSHATLYTGRHPISHGIVSHGGAADLSPSIPVLPELLQARGMATCAIDNLFTMKPWFARGYEFYIDPSFRHRARLMVTGDEINHRAIPWLRAHAGEDFFLFVHYWEPHTPYLPPLRYRGLFYEGDPADPSNTSLSGLSHQPLGDHWRDTWFPKLAPNVTDAAFVSAMYDSEIRYADDCVAELLAALEETGVAGETLVILTGDHGESLTEHDILFEHHGLYEPTVHVPLIVRWPAGGAVGGRREAGIVQHADFLPTLLEAVGGDLPQGVDGHSFLAALQGAPLPSEERAVVSEECTWQAKWSLRAGGHKLILAREPDLHGMPMRELYNLEADPGETRNLAEEEPALAHEMEQALEGWIRDQMARHGLAEDPLVAQGITLGRRWRARLAAQRTASQTPL